MLHDTSITAIVPINSNCFFIRLFSFFECKIRLMLFSCQSSKVGIWGSAYPYKLLLCRAKSLCPKKKKKEDMPSGMSSFSVFTLLLEQEAWFFKYFPCVSQWHHKFGLSAGVWCNFILTVVYNQSLFVEIGFCRR